MPKYCQNTAGTGRFSFLIPEIFTTDISGPERKNALVPAVFWQYFGIFLLWA
jgi:hypothetical protein